MFPLRDRTRRWICRTIFFAVGVIPTLSIIAWCMAMTSPGRVAEVREQFATPSDSTYTSMNSAIRGPARCCSKA